MVVDNIDLEANIGSEKQRIASMLIKAISEAPSVKDFRRIQHKILRGFCRGSKVHKLPGVVLFDEPHTYGLALMTINEITHERNKEALAGDFRHELDHYNESKEHDLDTRLGIMFGVDRLKILPDNKITYKKFAWITFISKSFPEGLSKDERNLAEKEIISAVDKLSPSDFFQKSRI